MPNEGFMHQLQVFGQCEYAPTENHPAYIVWKKMHEEAITTSQFKFFCLRTVVDNTIYLNRYIAPISLVLSSNMNNT
jgi:dual specificity phosphatase 12